MKELYLIRAFISEIVVLILIGYFFVSVIQINVNNNKINSNIKKNKKNKNENKNNKKKNCINKNLKNHAI